MKRLSIVFFAIVTLTIISCKDNAKENEPEVVTVNNTESETKVYEIAKTEAEFNDPKLRPYSPNIYWLKLLW